MTTMQPMTTSGADSTGSTTSSSSGSSEESTSTTGTMLECPYDEVGGSPAAAMVDMITGVSSPVLVVGDPLEQDVIYILEQSGAIKRIEPGVRVAPDEDWLSLPVISNFENGVLGLAFHPDYEDNGLIYVAHTPTGEGGNLYITEFSADASGVDVDSARDVIAAGQPQGNHNGGMIQFGPDGMLYISVGDGGIQNDGCDYGQNPNTYLGKILRIDPTADGTPEDAPGCPGGGGCGCSTPGGMFDYTIPDNPDFGGRPEIWSIGWRNPWRMSFDPIDGQLFVGDVGQGQWEEVTIAVAGTNAGWGDMEGAHCFNDPGCDDAVGLGEVNGDGLTMPVAEYNHAGGSQCSVIGLGNYRSCEVPDWDGLYFYGDLCSGNIWAVGVDPDTGAIDDRGQLLSTGGDAIFGGGYNAYGDVYITGGSPFGGGGFVARIGPQR